ncbi:MAG TPA: hypothetical protein PKA90_03325 [Ignavibacteria bacterium]|nr:hypothetical protein [Ignavibacteria bacterium]HMR39440.1 hypothetical protein [Ignavibacteria bacterium]
MLKSKAIDIIKTFSRDEFNRFLLYTGSPYFNINKNLFKITEELKNFYPDFSSEALTEEYLYFKVYGGEKFSYSVMKNLLSELIVICDRFLIYERLNRELSARDGNSIHLLMEYRERKLDKLFDIRSKKFEKELKKHKIQNYDLFLLSQNLEILKYQYHLHRYSHKNIIWKGFQKKAAFEICTISQFLYTTTVMLLKSSELLGGKNDDSIMITFVRNLDIEGFLKTVKPDRSPEYFFVNLYLNLLLMTLKGKEDISETYYYTIKNLFIKNTKFFSNLDRYDVLKSLRSYCIDRMKLFRSNFIDELFEIDKLLIEKVDYESSSIKWYIGEIFTEIVFLSIHMKNYKFAESFIRKYGEYLSDEIREFETGFTKAFLELEYGNAGRAMELLSKIKPVNTSMKILIKNLSLMIYFEKGYYEEAFSLLDAYRHFVKRDEKLTPERKKNYYLLQSIYNRFFRIRTEPEKYNDYDIKKLGEDIEKFYFLAGKQWYLRKLSELGKLVGKKKKNA